MATDFLVPWINSAGGDGSRNSMQTTLCDGNTTLFSFNFSGGYINKTDVRAYTYEPSQAVFTPLDLTDPSKWAGPSQLTITPKIAAGTYLVIYRETQKTVPLVDFSNGSVMNEANLDLMADQAVFATAEMADRFNAVNASASDATVRSVTALNTANTAIAQAAAAVLAAAGAVGVANAASGQVAGAVSTANAARDTANAIDGKAQAALDASASAVSTANAAKGTANGIDGKAQSALDASASAVSTANAAKGTADSATSTANAAKSTADGLAASVGAANTTAGDAVTTANATQAALSARTQMDCRLRGTSTTLSLSRYAGSTIVINGTQYTLPATPLTLSATGATATTLYYIYVFNNAGTLSLERSTTGPVVDAASGLWIKNGDVTRSFVGLAYAKVANVWNVSGTAIGVLSYYNRGGLLAQGFISGQATGAPVVMETMDVLTWGDEVVEAWSNGFATLNTTNQQTQHSLRIDGVSRADAYDAVFNANAFFSSALKHVFITGSAVGDTHVVDVLAGSNGAGTYTFTGSSGVTTRG